MENIINEVEAIDFDTLDAGDRVKSWCGKCKGFRMHTVQAKSLVAGKSPKSICMTCNAVHLVRYHRPGTRKKSTKKREVVNPALTWMTLVGEAEVEEWKPYKISGTYSKDDFVEHRKYGKGKVVKVLDKYKVQIIFEVETKTMLQNK